MKRTAIKRKTPIKKVSDKRRKEMAVYAELRDKHMKENPMCQGWLKLNGFSPEEIRNIQEIAVIALWQGMDVPPILTTNVAKMVELGLPKWCPRSFDLHHSKRRGKHYLDASSFLAVARSTHQWLHDHPKEARDTGLLL